jgi:formylglycine-generating enzyme required for sulfatase activity
MHKTGVAPHLPGGAVTAHPSVAVLVDRASAIEWYQRNRTRSRAIFDLIDPAAYYSRPIALRNPIVFYEGHLPAFSVIAFLRRGLGRPPIDERLETLFARGIDPESTDAAAPRSGASTVWPSRDEVLDFARRCDDAVLEALAHSPDLPADGLYTALEHEAMHQETLLYMWHRLPYEQKRRRSTIDDRRAMGDDRRAMGDDRRAMGDDRRAMGDERRAIGDTRRVVVDAGDALLGADRNAVPFGWDNEFDGHVVAVGDFEIDVLPVTNEQFLEFMNDGGYQRRDLWSDEGWSWLQSDRVSHPAFWELSPNIDHRTSPIAHRPSPIAHRPSPSAHRPSPSAHRPSTIAHRPSTLAHRPSTLAHRPSNIDHRPSHFHWRGMFDAIPLPLDWPVYVSHAEASAYARWKGRRLMTEPEFHRAAYGDGSREMQRPEGHFDFAGFDPVPVGSFAPSAFGVHDLVGNGWEWTSTVFGPFEGFTPMASYPEYSADFFDGRHFVLKGASPATARELIRPGFRNWFRGNYPYVYAKFRTVA